MASPTVWTIGHSTRTAEEFFQLLASNQIKFLADIRRFPASKRYPHFNKENLLQECLKHGIDYRHFPELGGRRTPNVNSIHTIWRNAAFRGYADYMDTDEFKSAAAELEAVALQFNTAYMCSEAVWWRCHRALLSDYFKKKGWLVLHIENANRVKEHPFTEPARQENLFS
jgi:uncharacterized protein (DUF488 family)